MNYSFLSGKLLPEVKVIFSRRYNLGVQSVVGGKFDVRNALSKRVYTHYLDGSNDV